MFIGVYYNHAQSHVTILSRTELFCVSALHSLVANVHSCIAEVLFTVRGVAGELG